MNRSMTAPFITLLVLMIVACSNSPMNKIEKQLEVKNSDTLNRIIPHQPDEIRRLTASWIRTLGVSKLENGSPDFQIRIWEDTENRNGNLYIFKNDSRNWQGELYRYRYYSHNFTPDSLSGKRTSLSSPTSGWDSFMNKLLDLDILKLPDHQSLLNYGVDADANFVKVEIAKKNYYRLYEYPQPQYRQNQFPEAKKILQILELVKKEFKL